jgi:hypothetical protein
MGNFEDRQRFSTFEEVKAAAEKCTGWIVHILKNDDKSFSLMMHINCEFCDYCTACNTAYEAGIRYTDTRERGGYPLVHRAVADPYKMSATKRKLGE